MVHFCLTETLYCVTGLTVQAIGAFVRVLVAIRARAWCFLEDTPSVAVLASGIGVGSIAWERMARWRFRREQRGPLLRFRYNIGLGEGSQLNDGFVQ